MNITAIELANYGSWEGPERVAIEPGVTLISGPNGAGKSTLLSAIEFALYGATSDAGRLIRRGTDHATVAVEVETDAGELRVERSIRRSGARATVSLELRQHVDGRLPSLTCATVTETQELLDGLLGVTREVLLASAFSTQHGGAAFTEAAPRDRKRIFGEVLSLGMWDALHEDAKAEAKDARERVVGEALMVEQYDGAAERRAEAAKRALQAGDALKAARISEQDADAEATRLAAEAEAAREARRQHAAAVEAANRARADHERATSERAAADEALQRAKTAAANTPSIADARALAATTGRELAAAETVYERAYEAHVRWRDAFSVATQVRSDLQSEAASGNCARCGQPLHDDVTDRLEAATAAVREFAASQPDVLDPEKALAAARDAAQAAQTRLAEAETIYALAGSIEAAEARAREAQERWLQTDENLRNANYAIEYTLDGLPGDMEIEACHAHALGSLDHARIAHRDAALDLARAETAAQQAERDATAETDARARLAAAQADAAVAGILAAGFGPQGVPALIVDSVLGQLADESNRVLAELGTPIRVDLRSQRVTKDNRLVDALDIIVLDGVAEAPYETLSGGERTRVALALRAALTRLLAAKSGARVRILVVDEPSGLDASGAEAFADVLQAFITAAIFETAIIVTHDERLADRIDRVVRVEKTPSGTSRLVENRGPTTPDAIEPDPGGADHGARTTVRAAASGIGRDGSHA